MPKPGLSYHKSYATMQLKFIQDIGVHTMKHKLTETCDLRIVKNLFVFVEQHSTIAQHRFAAMNKSNR